jgi:hypothetical protein
MVSTFMGTSQFVAWRSSGRMPPTGINLGQNAAACE